MAGMGRERSSNSADGIRPVPSQAICPVEQRVGIRSIVGGRCSTQSCCQRQRRLYVVIRLGQGERTLDRLLNAPLVRIIRRGVAAIEEHPCYAVRLD
jgi:hypothetical protein